MGNVTYASTNRDLLNPGRPAGDYEDPSPLLTPEPQEEEELPLPPPPPPGGSSSPPPPPPVAVPVHNDPPVSNICQFIVFLRIIFHTHIQNSSAFLFVRTIFVKYHKVFITVSQKLSGFRS